MAKNKVDVLLKTAEVNLRRAEKRLIDGEYDTAVFHASLAVESCSNALILKLGGSEAKNHRAVSGLAAVVRRTNPEWLNKESYKQLVGRGRDIEREVVYTRYPHKVAGVWTTPMEYYTREKTQEIIDDAKFVTDKIKEFLKRTNEPEKGQC